MLVTLIVVLSVVLAAIMWPGLVPGTDHPYDGPYDEPPPQWGNYTLDLNCSVWSCDITQVDQMQDMGYDGDGIVVGIVDTGIDTSHPDISPSSVIMWKDLVNGRPEPYDDEGHGTAMAGIIAADGRLEGVAPAVDLIVVKALNSTGSGSNADVASAIDFCVDPNGDGDLSDGADIISLSLGGGEHPRFGSEVGDAVSRATAKGVFVIASAGNDGGVMDDGDVESPANEEAAIAVGAVDKNLTIAQFSSIGDNDGKTPLPIDDRVDPNKKPEVVAPGVDIVTTYLGGKYVLVSGTSPAAAFLSGCLALVLEANPEYVDTGSSLAIMDVKEAIMNSSLKVDVQETPHDDYYGYGLVQVVAISDELSA